MHFCTLTYFPYSRTNVLVRYFDVLFLTKAKMDFSKVFCQYYSRATNRVLPIEGYPTHGEQFIITMWVVCSYTAMIVTEHEERLSVNSSFHPSILFFLPALLSPSLFSFVPIIAIHFLFLLLFCSSPSFPLYIQLPVCMYVFQDRKFISNK